MIFLLFFSGGPLVVEALGNCPVCPLLNQALVALAQRHILESFITPPAVGGGAVRRVPVCLSA